MAFGFRLWSLDEHESGTDATCKGFPARRGRKRGREGVCVRACVCVSVSVSVCVCVSVCGKGAIFDFLAVVVSPNIHLSSSVFAFARILK
jgi:hypothetical protein